MPLSWNKIRSRAISFVKEWEGESRERVEKIFSGMTFSMSLKYQEGVSARFKNQQKIE